MDILEHARVLRSIIEAAMVSVDDKTASEGIELSPGLRFNGELVPAGTRIQHNGMLYKAAVDLWDTPENAPEKAPNLWEQVMYKDGVRIIPQVITVTSQFYKGELGWWENKVYESLIDSNVYTPAQYAAGWKIVG